MWLRVAAMWRWALGVGGGRWMLGGEICKGVVVEGMWVWVVGWGCVFCFGGVEVEGGGMGCGGWWCGFGMGRGVVYIFIQQVGCCT